MFNTIRDLIKNATIVTIVLSDASLEGCTIIDVDDMFIAFRHPSNNFNYVYPLESVIQIGYPISP